MQPREHDAAQLSQLPSRRDFRGNSSTDSTSGEACQLRCCRQYGNGVNGLQVEMAIHDGAGKTKVETHDFKFKPQKTLFGYDATEKVEGWVCRIFEANGRMSAMEHLKVRLLPPPPYHAACVIWVCVTLCWAASAYIFPCI